MSQENNQNKKALLEHLIFTVLGWPWFEYLAVGWKLAHKLWRGMADEGMYEVLAYETTLELKDKRGANAQFSKRQKVKYLQNNIIAYQDQAWGDGEILLNYSCSPGVEVDRYRPGHKTYILISLREEKKKGDMDEFFIEWRVGVNITPTHGARAWALILRTRWRARTLITMYVSVFKLTTE